MEKTIRHQFVFPQPPELVWEYLTNSELLALWLMPNDFKPEVGHHFQFKTNPRIKLGFDGTVYCEVREVVPVNRLVYSWSGGLSKDNPRLNTVVTWTLETVAGGTRLTLEQSGFDSSKNFLAHFIMNKGWLKIGKRFGKRLQTHNHGTTA